MAGTVTFAVGVVVSVDHSTGIITHTGGPAPTSWSGEFDVPCRFDTDQMKVSVDSYNVYSWGQIMITEVRL